jgi:hypothetical protein
MTIANALKELKVFKDEDDIETRKGSREHTTSEVHSR